MIFLVLLVISNYFYLKSEAALRIFGGRDARRDEFPFVVRLEKQEFVDGTIILEFEGQCTGSALTTSWILSAAHCSSEEFFKEDGNKKLVVRYNSYLPKYQGSVSPVYEVKMHPVFTNVDDTFEIMDISLKNDLCLFRSENILVNRYGKISAVDYMSLIGHEANSLGHGLPSTPQVPKPLQVLTGMLSDCYAPLVSMLCLVPPCGRETTICGGDSGGPVVHSSGIVGVNSMSTGDCDEYTTSLNILPGTYSSIIATTSLAFDWISNVIANKSSNRF